jgi:hypothetical protein
VKNRLSWLVVVAACAGAALATVSSAWSSAPAAAAPVSEVEKIISPTYRYRTSGRRDVLCPAGKEAIGGGYHIVGGGQSLGFGADGFYVTINRPTDDSGGWRIAWYADIGVKRFYINVYAICART